MLNFSAFNERIWSVRAHCIWLIDGSFQVRAAPPPPKQHPRGQVKRREEVEITLVWRRWRRRRQLCSNQLGLGGSVPLNALPKETRGNRNPLKRPGGQERPSSLSSCPFTQHGRGFVCCGGILCLSLNYTPLISSHLQLCHFSHSLTQCLSPVWPINRADNFFCTQSLRIHIVHVVYLDRNHFQPW